MTKTLDKNIINAIIDGHHADPFAILGAHDSDDGLIIRCFLPNAVAVAVIDKDTERLIIELTSLDPRGFFSGLIPHRHQQLNYYYDVNWGNLCEQIEDPYAFDSYLTTLELDTWLMSEGKHARPYEVMGAHPIRHCGVDGVNFCVWAPNAKRVSVVGDFNCWDGRRHVMRFHPQIGIWEMFIPTANRGDRYKYEIIGSDDYCRLKADPFAFESELRPNTASIISQLPQLTASTDARQKANQFDAPISIYEVHLGSWRRNIHNNYWLDYDQIADELIPYVTMMGFTHIELLPIHEFPYDGSWGYQPLGLYSPTSRFGDPAALKRFIKRAHDSEINIIMDWVPGHFPTDEYGLERFDGSALYEHQDPKEGYHQDWNTLIYNHGRLEVSNFLSSNALYWLERFSVDGLRVDAVASMIYRDYSREDGQWIPNHLGGRENFEAIDFLQRTNHLVGTEARGSITIAEESTVFSGVTRPPESGGLGFHYKWNMGWMNDTLSYMQKDPIHRKHHHEQLTFGMLYNYSENFILPISHDEVVHGKGSMLDKMPGDTWQKFANLRAYYGYMWGYPGKKLLFMGCEFAQGREWNYDESLDWYLLDEAHGGKWHKGVQQLIKDLNHCYRHIPALHELDMDSSGFEWLVPDDRESSVFVFERYDRLGHRVMVISNFTPIRRECYRIGVHRQGIYREVLNTDSAYYHGSNVGNSGDIHVDEIPSHGKPYSMALTLPPLSTLFLQFSQHHDLYD